MKFDLRYHNGKTLVEVNGKWMSVAKAMILHPSLGLCRKEIAKFSEKAKQLSQIKLKTYNINITETRPDMWEGRYDPIEYEAKLYINGKRIGEFVSYGRQPNEAEIKSLVKNNMSVVKKELGISESEIDKINWTHDAYFVNGKQISNEEGKFIQSYLSYVKFDTNTKRITNPIEPSNFRISNFNCHGTLVR